MNSNIKLEPTHNQEFYKSIEEILKQYPDMCSGCQERKSKFYDFCEDEYNTQYCPEGKDIRLKKYKFLFNLLKSDIKSFYDRFGIPLRYFDFLSPMKRLGFDNNGKLHRFIYGTTGTGKSTYAYSQFIIECIFGAGNVVLNDEHFFSHLNSLEYSESYATINQIKNCNFLLWDDFGAKSPGNKINDHRSEIISYRYEKMLPTWITSNYNIPELAARLTDNKNISKDDMVVQRMVSRIKGDCTGIEFKGNDLRLKK